MFGISQLPNDQSIPLLVDLLEHNRSREVRKKAAFWLGRKNDPRALAAMDVLRQ
jgi:HEAT repeat protein